ncbi:MAG: hypothetical protein ACM3SY_13850 [Candidatus Omnitrophota bacterium]
MKFIEVREKNKLDAEWMDLEIWKPTPQDSSRCQKELFDPWKMPLEGPEIASRYMEFMIRNKKSATFLNLHQAEVKEVLKDIGVTIPKEVAYYFSEKPINPSVWLIKGEIAFNFSEQFSTLIFSGKPLSMGQEKVEVKEVRVKLLKKGDYDRRVWIEDIMESAVRDKFGEIIASFVEKEWVQSVEEKKLDVSEVFTSEQLEIIENHSEEIKGFKVLVCLPFFDFSYDKIFRYALDKDHEVILSSC